MNLTLGQKIALLSITLGALAGGTAQLTPIFGSVVSADIASLAALANTIVSGWIFVVTGQGAQMKNVAAMPGVEKVLLNSDANAVAATLAMDKNQDKIAPTPSAETAVAATAKAAAS